MRKAILNKQGPPGPPPRPGLQWNPQSHRWIRPQESGSSQIQSRTKDITALFQERAIDSILQGDIDADSGNAMEQILDEVFINGDILESLGIDHPSTEEEEEHLSDIINSAADGIQAEVDGMASSGSPEEEEEGSLKVVPAINRTVIDLMYPKEKDIDEEMDGRGDPDAWLDERVEAIQSVGSTDDPWINERVEDTEALRSSLEYLFNHWINMNPRHRARFGGRREHSSEQFD